MTRTLFFFLRLLERENSPLQITWGICFGFLLAMLPTLTLQFFVILTLFIISRAHFPSAILSFLITLPLSFGLQVFFHHIGAALLTIYPSIFSILEWLYNAPIVPYTRFNHSVVLGASLTAFGIVPLLFWICHRMIQRKYDSIVEWLLDTRISRTWLNSDLKLIYDRSSK